MFVGLGQAEKGIFFYCKNAGGTAHSPAAGFKSVSIGPGWILLTVMPRLPTSLDNP
jgi:hypothetical protein